MPVTEEEQKKYIEFVQAIVDRLNCLKVDNQELVWHYTTGEALINIIEAGTLYATQVACLNDSTEVLYGSNLLRDAFLALQTEDGLEQKEIQLLERIVKASVEQTERPSDWFVTCFSKEKDDLSQWRAYGGGENGYAIAFLAGAFFNRGSRVARVNYDGDAHRQAAREIARATLTFYKEGFAVRAPEEADRWADEFLTEWNKWTNQLAPMVKDPAFRGENEYRIIHEYKASEISKLRFKQKQSLMSLHLPLVFPPPNAAVQSSMLPIMEVMVGPGRHKEQSRLGVEVILRQKGYYSIPVSVSKIPFQNT